MDKQPDRTYTETVKNRIIDLGADLVGIADVQTLRDLPVLPPDLMEPFSAAISIAVGIPVEIFRQITEIPSPAYYTFYQAANSLLNEIALRTANALYKDGFSSLPIPAAQRWDRVNALPAISHKAVGNVAGLGWQGKSLLLINPIYGPRIRLVTVLTDAPLVPDKPIENRCGTCRECIDACPAGAIFGKGTDYHYERREDACDWKLCQEHHDSFSALPNPDAKICGICIQVCPFGR